MLVGGEDRVMARGVEVRCPGHRDEIREAAHVGAIRAHGVDVGVQPFLVEAAPDDSFAVDREERAAVVAGGFGQPRLVAAVGVHDVDLAEVGGIGFQALAVFLRQALRRVGAAQRCEDDPCAVGGIGSLGVVARCVGQPLETGSVTFGGEHVHVLVVVPVVAALLARSAELALFTLPGLRLGIEMRRREQHAIRSRTEERAGGLADAGRNTVGVPGGEIEMVDLEERIAGFPLALEDERLAVGGEVAFTGAASLEGDLPRLGEEPGFGVGRNGRRGE